MQLPVGLLLLLTFTLLHHACCETTGRPNPATVPPEMAAAQVASDEVSPDGDVVVQDGEETEPYVETYDIHNSSMEVIMQEIEKELHEDRVNPTGDYGAVIEELAEGYMNGTLQGEPTYHHTALDDAQKNTAQRRIDKRQYNPNDRLWEKGIIPYWFTSQVSEWGQSQIKAAMKYFEDSTCLRFPAWSKTVHADNKLPHQTYLNYVNRGGCWSNMGRYSSGKQDISCCNSYSTALHELGHALGLEHEQDRSDRDLYVTLHPENAARGKAIIYNRAATTFGKNYSPYDYGSRMHYILKAFSRNGKKTITVDDKRDEFLVGRRETTWSHYDLMSLTALYGCTAKCPAEKKALKCQNDGFVDVHCNCKCPEHFTGELCETLTNKPPWKPSAWPSGSYGLPATKDGCPANGNWSTGSRTHAMESGSYASSGYLKPFGNTLVTDHFCMKSDAASGSGDWPTGSYCIYRQGDSCPTGFKSGHVLMDDDNERSGENNVNGSLPAGVYNQDTKYFYCCRYGKRTYLNKYLPTESPFILFMAKNTGCQDMYGMIDTYFFMYYDEEDTSPISEYVSPYPTYLGRPMTGCYYQPIKYDCGGLFYLNESNPSVNISSPNYPEDYMDHSCLWYIKGPKGKTMVLDIHDLNLKASLSGSMCVDSLEVRRTLIAQPGERFCGKGPKSSMISYAGFFTMKLHPGQIGSKKGFTSTVRLISDSEQCYNPEDRGSSYRGKVDYSQFYHKCMLWDQVQHCDVRAFRADQVQHGLTHAYCRNPNNLLRPWCYINDACDYDFCDVCGFGRCHDISNDCAASTAKDPKYCDTNDGFRMCHKTCKFCGRGHEKPVSSCSKPDLTEKNAVIDPSYENQATFKFGEKVKIQCKEKLDDKLITRDLTCTTDGNFAGNSLVCCAGTACPDGYTGYRDACYKLFGPDIHMYADYVCNHQEAASVASIADDDENNFVKQMAGGLRIWIGYERGTNENAGQWVWDDGVKRNYTNWRSDEQRDGNYVIMDLDGTWDDITDTSMTKEHKYICKKHNKSLKATCPCADESSECTELIKRNYNLCRAYEKYSFTHCHSSCGFCGKVANCKNPGKVANTVQKTTAESITTGNYFEYECSSGTELISGGLGQTCLKDGTLAGTPPVCEPYVGHKAVQGSTVDSPGNINYMYIVRSKSMNFTKSGSVKAWKLYSNSAADIQMMVVRPVAGSDTKFMVVGINAIKAPNGEVAVVPVVTADRIRVKPGDVIAWYYMPGSNPEIPYTECIHASGVKTIWAGPGPYTVGQEVSGTVSDWRPCRVYSIGAVMDYETM